MEHYREYHYREDLEDGDPPEARIPIKHLLGEEFVEEMLVSRLNDLVEQLPNSCRDPEELMIEQEEELARALGWPEITRRDWDDPEQALLNFNPATSKEKLLALANLAPLTRKQRRLAWEAYQERRA